MEGKDLIRTEGSNKVKNEGGVSGTFFLLFRVRWVINFTGGKYPTVGCQTFPTGSISIGAVLSQRLAEASS